MNVSCLEALPNNQPCQKPVERKTRAAAEHGGEGKASAREIVPERARVFVKRRELVPEVDLEVRRGARDLRRASVALVLRSNALDARRGRGTPRGTLP